MDFKDVKIKHIYSVNFDTVLGNEFNGTHFALVLKKNNEKLRVL